MSGMGQVAARAIGQKIRIDPLHGDATHEQRDLLFAGTRAANVTPSSKNSPAWSPR
jgi:hypothetical protein